MKIIAVQLPMAPTVADNLASILRSVDHAVEDLGADVVLFPECALTGFHKDLPDQCTPEILGDALGELQAMADELDAMLLVGTPWPLPDGRMLNALAVLRPIEDLLVAPKIGLSESELQFFTAGTERTTWTWLGARFASVICREMLDPIDPAQLGDVDVVFWPGYIAWDAGDDDYMGAVSRVARALKAVVVQANWPDSLNAPETRGMGGSVVVGPDGELVFTGPRDAPAFLEVELT